MIQHKNVRRSVTTHKTQNQIVVSFGCLHFEAAFSLAVLPCSALCMYILHPLARCVFSFLLCSEHVSLRLLWAYLRSCARSAHLNHLCICIAPEDRSYLCFAHAQWEQFCANCYSIPFLSFHRCFPLPFHFGDFSLHFTFLIRIFFFSFVLRDLHCILHMIVFVICKRYQISNFKLMQFLWKNPKTKLKHILWNTNDQIHLNLSLWFRTISY